MYLLFQKKVYYTIKNVIAATAPTITRAFTIAFPNWVPALSVGLSPLLLMVITSLLI